MTLRSYFSTIVFCCVFTCSVAHASSDLIVPKNISEFEELTVAAENGDSEAQRNVGFLYRNGCQEIGLEVDSELAFTWTMKAAKLNNYKAQEIVAICYSDGDGVEEDKEEGFQWLLKAYESGSMDACYFIGLAYNLGEGVELDYEKGVEWLIKGSDHGIKRCLMALGWNYKNGFGVERDVVLAHTFCTLGDATEWVKELRNEMYEEEIAESQQLEDEILEAFNQKSGQA